MHKVIVTDSSERAALAIIRSLGRKGIEVTAADSTNLNAGFLSKYCSRRVIYPSPQKNKKKFVKSILKLVKNENFDLLIPVTDFTMIPILEHKDEFEKHVKVAAPPYETAIKAYDKIQTVKIAEKHGLPCPKTIFLEDPSNLKEIATHLSYPVVIKPRMKVSWVNEKAIVLKVTDKNYAYDSKDLVEKYMNLVSKLNRFNIPSDFLLIQEYVKGHSYGVEVLMFNSKPKAIFAHKRLREYPITGGASTLRISVRNKKLENYAVSLLKAMNWEGIAMVEFKLNEKTGNIKLIEVNGRFWGSLALAINAGVDFPYLLYKCIIEERGFNIPNYKTGIKQKWLIPGDILWLYSSIVKKGKILDSIKEFITSFTVPDDIILLNDLKPTVGSIKTSLNLLIDVIKGQRNISGEIL